MVQYQRDSSNSNTFRLVKDYGYVENGQILSSERVGEYCLFGGSDYSVVAVHITKRVLCKGRKKTAFERISSLQVCYGGNGKVYLSVGGNHPVYSSKVSDILDVTGLCEGEGMSTFVRSGRGAKKTKEMNSGVSNKR